ncbi:MAG: hypothetical protein CL583_13475 [Alteromonadaceae bacterium]|nr:hypothetical protein [Alteromonadaceae bacterium]|tara:strand:- start:1886 stop:2311 length:426 start_codon:yes stop_codon:yes gene_type:complete
MAEDLDQIVKDIRRAYETFQEVTDVESTDRLRRAYTAALLMHAPAILSDRDAKDATIRALQEENEGLRETFAMRDKLVNAGIHLALSNSDIYNLDMSPAPAINSWHESEAKRLAREAYDEYEQAQIEQLQRDMDEEDTPND